MIVARFAPSPSGRLHLGHAYSAALGRAAAERFLLRIEDLDPGRCRPEFVAGIEEDLAGSGSRSTRRPWSSPSASRIMPRRSIACATQGLVYPCFCTRADIAASLTAPHGDAGSNYPGTCRGLPDDPARARRRRRTAGGSTAPRRWRATGLPAGASMTATTLHRHRRPTSATRSSRARMRPPPTISPASSTMPRAG